MKKIAIASGKYMKEGVEKTSWVNVGIIGMSQNGKEYCLLDPKINLAGFTREPGKDMLMCSIFDDSNQGQAPQPQGGYGQPAQQQSQYQAPVQQQSYNQPQQQNQNQATYDPNEQAPF